MNTDSRRECGCRKEPRGQGIPSPAPAATTFKEDLSHMNFINNRLRRLEERTGERCPECALPPGAPERIAIERIPEGAEEICPSCGRPLWIIIRVVYEGDEEGEGY